MYRAYIVLPTGEWLHLENNEMHYDVIKRSGFLDDFNEEEPDAYKYYHNLGYTDNDKISDKDEEAFEGIEFDYNQRAVAHALKKGVLRIRYYKAGDINRNRDVILINGEVNRITAYIIETSFEKFKVPNTTMLSIEDCDGKEIFKGTYDRYKG